jgi:hypothetical protein
MRRACIILVASFLAAVATAVTLAASASAQSATADSRQPRIVNGRLSARPAGSPFVQSVRSLVSAQTDAVWIGYTAPMISGDRVMCCFSSGGSSISGTVTVSDSGGWLPAVCGLEPAAGDRATPNRASAPQGPVKLEGADRMTVLFRVADRQIERVRMFSEECELDAGGRQVLWLEGVRPADSLALLESVVTSETDNASRRVANGAISAIAMHADTSADGLLERLARRHASATVRGEAIFWLAQKAGDRATRAITDSIDNDPDTEVKKRAVFALSQLPKGQGVPLLIDVARKNANPAVKRQAIFWLGQSNDPRAIDFFAEILK